MRKQRRKYYRKLVAGFKYPIPVYFAMRDFKRELTDRLAQKFTGAPFSHETREAMTAEMFLVIDERYPPVGAIDLSSVSIRWRVTD